MPFIEPRRQHPLGVLILAAQFIFKFAQQFWPALVVGSFGDNVVRNGLLTVGIFVAVSSAYAILYYLRFRFSVEGQVLVLEKGVLRRERLQVPFERIQTIQLYQGPLQQIFRLTGVRVDTAGSSGSELQLVAIRKDEAAELQAILRSTASTTADPGGAEGKGSAFEDEGGQDVLPGGASVERGEDPVVHAPQKELVTLGWGALLKVGLSQNHLRNAFAGLALVLYGLGNVPEQITAWMESLPAIAAPLIGVAFFLLIIPGILLFLMGGIAVSMGTAILKYFNLKSGIGAEGLHAEMGLLRRQAFEVPFARIHLTEWRSNWIRRKFDFETLEVRQAMAESATTGGLRVYLPAMEPTHRALFEAAVYPDLQTTPMLELLPVRRLRWLLWVAAATPTVLFWLVWTAPAAGLATALWLAFTGFTTAQRFGSLRLTAHEDTIVLERGWFWRRRTVLRMAQLQGVEWKRLVFLERRSIGHLVFHTAAGARRFAYVDKVQGHALRDLALNQHHARSSRA